MAEPINGEIVPHGTPGYVEPAGRPCIYGLFGNDGRLRYIGKANDPAARLMTHMRDARRRDTPLYRWIRKHGKPQMFVLWGNDGEWDWRDVERLLISGFRASGADLLNVSEGGDEPACSLETRQANARAVARAIHDDPVRKAEWRRRQRLGATRAGAIRARDRCRAKAIKAKL